MDQNQRLSREVFNSFRISVINAAETFFQASTSGTVLSNVGSSEISTMTEEDIVQKMSGHISDVHADRINKYFDALNNSLTHSVFVSAHAVARDAIRHAADQLGCEARFVTFEQASAYGYWGEHAPFNAQLTRLFARYRDELVSSARKATGNANESDSDSLDASAFVEKFGIAPWEQISTILDTFGLNYRVAPPPPRTFDPVTLYFERLDRPDTYVGFNDLSAGEKVLVILAVGLLNVDPTRAVVRRPQLLLLDEIDASLHPAVLHQWMTTIRERVVGELGIPCIMTTHSPVTVALAPEASLFEMGLDSVPLRKIAQREALNKLTVGLPSMNADFTQRRQVFVEAEGDAQAYDELHSLIKAELQLPCSLSFLSTGIKRDKEESGTGCAAVVSVVDKLTSFGNLSTFGLLDWDGKTEPRGRIHVLAQDTHYAFDNVILHPLLVGLLLIRDKKSPAAELPRFGGADGLEVVDLQRISDAVENKLSFPDGLPAGRAAVHFMGGVAIETRQAFLHCNGHTMEDEIEAAFPAVKAYTGRGRGKLALAVVKHVIGDYPNFCPQPIVDAFRQLATMAP